MNTYVKKHRDSLDLTGSKKNIISPLKQNTKSNHLQTSPGPKFIRKQQRFNSSVSGSPTLIHHSTNHSVHLQLEPAVNPALQTLEQCLDILHVISLKSRKEQKKKLILLRSCSLPGNSKQTIIAELIEQMLPRPKKNLDAEIEAVMHELMEEKKQKEQAIQQGKNLLRQQEWQVQQLKSRLIQYQS